MYLVHQPSGKHVQIAKYYPSGGWGANPSLVAQLDAAFNQCSDWYPNPGGMAGLPLSGDGMWGANHWEVHYESNVDQWGRLICPRSPERQLELFEM